MESPASALARVLVTRRQQLVFRLGLAVVSAVGSQALTGRPITLVWLAAYVAVQVGEQRAFRDVSTGTGSYAPTDSRGAGGNRRRHFRVRHHRLAAGDGCRARGGWYAPRWCGPARS
jgi:hypothetical protein